MILQINLHVQCTCAVFSSPKKEHQRLNTNANRLHVNYKIPLHTAYDIIKSCPVCAPLHCRSHPSCANPRGLHTNELMTNGCDSHNLFSTATIFTRCY
jgi:hypothetical protein